MSMTRFILYRGRLGTLLGTLCGLLVVSALLAGVTAFAQGTEIAGGMKIAEGMVGRSLAEGALLMAGLCVGALCYVVKVAYQMHVEQVKSTIAMLDAQRQQAVDATKALDNAAKQVENLTDELRKRPCMGYPALPPVR